MSYGGWASFSGAERGGFNYFRHPATGRHSRNLKNFPVQISICYMPRLLRILISVFVYAAQLAVAVFVGLFFYFLCVDPALEGLFK